MNKCERVQQAIEKNPKAGNKIINKLSKLNMIQEDWTDIYKSDVIAWAEEISLELEEAEEKLGNEIIKIK